MLKNKYIAKGKKVKALASFLDAHIKVDQATLADDDDYDSGDEDERWVMQYCHWWREKPLRFCHVDIFPLSLPRKSMKIDLDGRTLTTHGILIDDMQTTSIRLFRIM